LRLTLVVIAPALVVFLTAVTLSMIQGARRNSELLLAQFGPRCGQIRAAIRAHAAKVTGKPPSLSLDDLSALRRTFSAQADFDGCVAWDCTVSANGRPYKEWVYAAGPDHFTISGSRLQSGARLDSNDEMMMRRVCLLGSSAARKLFGGTRAVGRTLIIRGVPFTVKGVRRRQVAFTENTNDEIWIPLSTGMRRVFGLSGLSLIEFKVRKGLDVQAVCSRVAAFLRTRHRIVPPEKDDFRVFASTDLAENYWYSSRAGREGALLICILSFFVAGAVMMHILTLSMAGRHSEIGLRRALGASRRSVLAQFIFEVTVLCAWGLLAGTVAAWICVGALHHYQPGIFRWYAQNMTITGSNLLLTSMVAFVEMLVFGTLPALRAANVDPVIALRGT
jgi:ABC-type antimicrobial peptide transport system permease subunit